MGEVCNQSCSACSEECAERKEDQIDFSENPHELSSIKKVIGIVSGKGGVGKSLVTSMMAVEMNRRGYKTAILDADITGPSIPKAFGLKDRAGGSELGLYPVKSKTGIDVMSVNLLLEDATDPVIWRGPMIAGVVKQFWTDVIWEDVDYMFIDMPPGTGDVPLTVFQSVKVDGIIIVTSPQELVSMIVTKAVKMAEQMDIPILGIVENMSYFKCPDCNENHTIFGDSNVEEIAIKHGIKTIAKLPIDSRLAACCDKGMIELFDGDWVEGIADIIEGESSTGEGGGKAIKIAVASEVDEITEHFGHCVNFNIFEAEEGRILNKTSVPNPGHRPGFLPNFLNDMGVNVIIAGGMGGGAVDIFKEKGIEVITGVYGNAEAAATRYLHGILAPTGIICQAHSHGEGCGH